MSDARTITMDMVREAMRSHCKPGVKISNAELFRLLDLKCEKEKDRLRTRLNCMVNQGEVKRTGRGTYEYNFKFRHRKNTTFPVIWRFVRMQKPGWSFSDICQLTRISYSQVKRYCEWLENEGYIARHGKDGNTFLYRATDKATKTPETPYPDITDRNPFERENAAAAELARLMLCHDPYQATTARKIVTACRILQARFDPAFKQNEKPQPRKGEDHMTQADFIKAIQDELGPDTKATKTLIGEVLKAAGNVALNTVSNGETVDVFGLGKIKVVQRAARMGRNPRTNEAIQIPAKRAVKYTASNAVRDALK